MKTDTDKWINPKLTRRTFVKASAASTVVAGVAMSNPVGSAMTYMDECAAEDQEPDVQDDIVPGNCRSNCFQSCYLNVHVRDGKLIKTTTAPYEDAIYSGSCLKGLSHVQRTYSPTRIKYPMKRQGARGEGKWERISWQEAIDEISSKFTSIQEKYGSRAVAFDIGSGNYGLVHGVQGIVNRLANSIGATKLNTCYDQATGYGADRVIGGGIWRWGNEPRTMRDAKNILVWGSNPVYAQPQNWRIVKDAQDQGAKVTVIDPIYSATANEADEYIAITPGSDLMLALYMLKHVLEEEHIDLNFVTEKSSAPFLIRRDNGQLLRKSHLNEGTDPEADDFYVWDASSDKAVLVSEGPSKPAIEGSYTVEGIETDTVFTMLKQEMNRYTLEETVEMTGISKETIHQLIETYLDGPTTIYTNYGIDHYQNGHLWAVTAFILAAVTGNIAKPGAGFTGLYVQSIPINYYGMYVTNGNMADERLPMTELHKVMRDGELEGEPYVVKALYSTSANSMSNYCSQNEWHNHILPNLDFIVCVDTEITDSASYADIVLPAAFWFEVNDLRVGYNNPYIIYQEKAIDPLYESKPDSEIIALIGRAMGLAEFFPEDYDDDRWIELLLDDDLLRAMNITFERLKKEKVIRGEGSAEHPFIRGEHGFNTESGRANLYCENPVPRVDFGQDVSHLIEKERFPYFKPPGEAWKKNPLYAKYPLVYVQEHSRYRVHTQWFNVPMLRELDPEPLAKISRADAESRGIQTGDIVTVFNDRGSVAIKAEVNDAISPGVLSIPKGWQKSQFIQGGYQEMTNSETDPMAVNFPFFDSLVEVKKREGEGM